MVSDAALNNAINPPRHKATEAKERRLERTRRWRARNRQKCLQYGREYRRVYVAKKRKEDPLWQKRVSSKTRILYNSNPEFREKVLSRNSRWRATERGRHYHRAYEASRPRKDRRMLSFEDWSSILKTQSFKCNICGRDFCDSLPPQRDHIYPRILGGLLTKENTQALCKPCNTRKGAKT